MTIIHTDRAPRAIGPYSQAIRTGSLLFCSGQTPLDPQTMQLASPDIAEQTIQCISNLQSILTESGLALSHIVKTNVYLTSMDDFQKMNAAYASIFQDHQPARTTVAVRQLPADALVEIDCIAEFKQ